ncbi:NADP-dependent oxidoreductase [Pseudonocardia endophytica]|uniref:NADPH:quinone reductase-like Zn-dependent oxidoreductase n=1 Tax=Pseudonocardia endophytica TaxID=401976 RepID=A0A4R1HW45_PSEEN|nr:NADP-dependent oxidoreductase [Pseudonocardia endophytica]TCK25671.1 NADPH:quinone reductase-like Zn-dependent oxidoreductase [Pseudonocardia endophytica]
MKAALFRSFGGPDVLEIADLPDPHPGPGQVRIAVHAAGVSPTDATFREGVMGGDLPQTVGRDVAGVVDAVGPGVESAALGDRVFGVSDDGAGAAELALVTHFAAVPPSLDLVRAAALPVAVETATRSMDALGVGAGTTLLVNGASGAIGAAAVQLAVARGARVIGIAGPANQDYVRALGAEPVTYGDGVADRVPSGVDVALDIAGNGVLPELIALAGGPGHVVTIADVRGARENGVLFSTGEQGRAFHALAEVAGLVEQGRFTLPVSATYPLTEIAAAHRALEERRGPGRIVLTVDS